MNPVWIKQSRNPAVILQVIPVEAPVVDVSPLSVVLTVGAAVDWADETTVVAAPIEVSEREVIVAELRTIEDDASELCPVVVAVVPAVDAMTWEVGSAVEVPADVNVPENGYHCEYIQKTTISGKLITFKITCLTN